MKTLEKLTQAIETGYVEGSHLSLHIEAKAEIERLEKKLDTARMELQRLQDIVSPADAESIERVLKETI